MKNQLKIVIIGGESTGKSTLTVGLAKHFSGIAVDEYARMYLENLGRLYVKEDLLQIAQGQIKLEDDAVKSKNKYVFIDTDLHVIKVWSEYKYGNCDPWILNQIAQRTYDAYILTMPDFEWVDDILREHPEPELTNYFYKQYLDIVSNASIPFCIVSGSEMERIKSAIEFLEKLGYKKTLSFNSLRV